MKRLLSFLWMPLLLLAIACSVPLQTGNSPDGAESNPPPSPTPLATPVTVGNTPDNQPSVSPTPPQVIVDDEAFTLELTKAIVRRNFEAMRAAMGERFTLAFWRSEGSEMSANEAIESLRETYFGQGSDPVTDTSIDLPRLLEGADPLLIFGPQSKAVRAFHITSLGSDARGEAIAVISRDPETGRLYWHGVLIAMNGFQRQPEPVGELNAFGQQLATAIEARDFNTLRALMPDRFSIATWNTQLLEFTSEEALQQLRQDAFSAGSSPVVIFGTDVTTLLNGTDPLSLWGPVANPIKALHVMGLGNLSNKEAVLVIGQDRSSGAFYWHGILIPPDGYFHSSDPQNGDVLETEVKYVIALVDVNVRSGPGLNFATEGLVRAGQIAKVSGVSPDRGWWRIICSQDASGFCWVSSDPTLTEPTNEP